MEKLLIILLIFAALSSAAFAVTGDVSVEGRLGVTGIVNVGIGKVEPEEMLNVYGNLRVGTTESGTVVASKELVLRQDGDTYGSSILRLRNRNGENGAIYETTDPTITLIDFIFKTADVSSQRNIRLEARPASARTGDPSFHIGGGAGAVADPDNPSLSVGDSYVAVAKKLSIGTYASFDAALGVSGDATVTGVVTAASFSGNGAALTALSASNISAGKLPVANGGTGQSAARVAGGVIYGFSATIEGVTAAGSQYQYLQSAGAGTPVWAQPGPASVQIFNAAGSGTYTTPAGVKAIIIELVGGGGGSGGIVATGATANNGCAGGGGGSGGYTRKLIVNPSASYSYTVGAGGTAGAATGTAGGYGVFTSFNTTIVATGGAGGAGCATAAAGTVALGGAGAVAGSGGDFMATGGAGGGGFSARYVGIGGQGGHSIFGGGAISGMAAINARSAGTNGTLYGSGASGPGSISSGTNQAAYVGNTGAAGVIIVYEYK